MHTNTHENEAQRVKVHDSSFYTQYRQGPAVLKYSRYPICVPGSNTTQFKRGAHCTNGSTDPQKWVCVSLLCCHLALPKPPTSLVVTDVTANSARLTWNSGNVDPVQSYVVQYRHKYASDSLYDEIFDVAATEYTVLGLNAHTVYEFRVVAVNAIGRSLPSTPVDVTTGELGT